MDNRIDTEVRLRVNSLKEIQEDFLVEEFDAHIARHGQQTFVTVLLDGSVLETLPEFIKMLAANGVQVHSVIQDLVTTTEIADRLGVSRQAVNNWCRAARKASSPFPSPSVVSGVSLWDWGEVAGWARDQLQYEDPINYLSPDEIAVLNGRLAATRLRFVGWMSASVGVSWISGSDLTLTLMDKSVAESSKQADFTVAA
ncbi:hypothetical protein [Pseudarthrobacter oxydans]|uniref:hypothetical protein n=1 Tax=Pseudarthrobacter oxydans TaxID=1671 RepID=UPI00344FD0B5